MWMLRPKVRILCLEDGNRHLGLVECTLDMKAILRPFEQKSCLQITWKLVSFLPSRLHADIFEEIELLLANLPFKHVFITSSDSFRTWRLLVGLKRRLSFCFVLCSLIDKKHLKLASCRIFCCQNLIVEVIIAGKMKLWDTYSRT